MERAFLELDADELLGTLEDSGLRGRGGAGFSMGKKGSFLPRGEMEKYLCCNADESEPGAFKDRELMGKNPHQLIEGVAIAALAVGAAYAFIFIRGEYWEVADGLDRAVAEAYEAGYLGRNVLNTGMRVELDRAPRRRRLHLRRGDGAARRARGQARQPAPEAAVPRGRGPLRRPDADQQRRDALQRARTSSPTARTGSRASAPSSRRGRRSCRSRVACSGPGNYEVELGIPSRELIYDLAGGPFEGRRVKAWFPGGSSSPVLTEAELDLPYSFEAMAEAGSMLGSGSIIIADDTISIPHLALRTARFYHHESCGKCTPCREGTNWTVKMLERITRGEATPMDLEIIASVQENIIGHCLCVLGDSMAMPVGAMVKKFPEEFREAMESARPAVAA